MSGKTNSINECHWIQLPCEDWSPGFCVRAEPSRSLPFEIRRVYYLYDVPRGAVRGAHAHIALHQLMIAVKGDFEVVLDDGRARRTETLNTPEQGLYIAPGIWRNLKAFSANAICLVLASEVYDEADYLRDYDQFRAFKRIQT